MFSSRLLLGLAILILGRKLLWLFIGGVSFTFMSVLLELLLPGESQAAYLTVGLVAGLMSALLAIFLREHAVSVSGFFAGGAISISLLELLDVNAGQLTWLVIALGGLLGVAIVAGLLEGGVIYVSSITGAIMVAQAFHHDLVTTLIVIIGLTIAGSIVQGIILKLSQAGPTPPVAKQPRD
jgi:hypothetical protein